jgi:pyruvate carboxylase subunit B
MNVIQMEKGKERWSMIADNIWDMILGKSGQLPGPVAPEIVAMAKEQGREFETDDPQNYYPDDLADYRQKMEAQGWELGEDDEELFEYSMHPSQYEAYKSGKAKADFEKDLAERKAKKNAPAAGAELPKTIKVSVNGQTYEVNIAYGNEAPQATQASASAPVAMGEGEDILAPLDGKFYRTKDSQEQPIQIGQEVKAGDTLGYIEAMKTYNAIRADFDGILTAVVVNSGDAVEEDDVIMKIQRK